MANNRNNFFGVGLIPSSATSNSTPGDIEYLNTDGKLHIQGASVNDAIVQEALASTLTNKSISGSTNTLTAIANTSLTNSSITVNGATIALGGTATVTATATNALTIGTGLTGTSYNGSAAVTVAIDATVATLAGTQTLTNKSISGATNTLTNIPDTALSSNIVTLVGVQTLTNKTLTSPVLNTPTSDTISGIGGNLSLSGTSTLSLTSPALRLNNLQVSGTTISDPTNTGITLTTGNLAFGINLNATGSAAIQFQRAGTQVAYIDTGVFTLVNQNSIKFNDAGAGYVSIKSPASVSTPYTITLPAATPTTGTALVYNGTNYVWGTVSGGGAANSNYTVDNFSGTGSQTVYTLSIDPLTKNNTLINISGVIQQKSTYTVTGTTLTFSSPPPVGTNNIEVISGTAAPTNSAGYTSSIQIALSASATLTTSLVAGLQAIEVAGASAAITLSSTPFGVTAPTDKAVIMLIGRSTTNTVIITNNDIAFGTIVNGTATLGLYNTIEFMYLASVSRWIETSRN